MLHFLTFLLLFQTNDVPFRPNEEFQVEIKYDLKQRPPKNLNSIELEAKKTSAGLLPYLVVFVKILKTDPGEVRFRCERNVGGLVFNKKASQANSLKIEVGYIDDVKDQVTANEFNLYSIGDDKKRISRIELKIMKDGTFLVNGEKRGKF